MAYKQNPKSPILKALVGNQHKLPQHLQDAIKAAPESPAKMYKSPAKLDDPTKRKKSKEELRKEKEAKASAFMDSLREQRAKKAEQAGDRGRAQRIRSTKNRQDGVK